MSEQVSDRSTVVASSNQVSSDLGGEIAILDLKGGKYYGLDEVGARVWALIQKPAVVSEVQAAIAEEYDVEPALAHRDVLALLQRLAEEELIEVT